MKKLDQSGQPFRSKMLINIEQLRMKPSASVKSAPLFCKPHQKSTPKRALYLH